MYMLDVLAQVVDCVLRLFAHKAVRMMHIP